MGSFRQRVEAHELADGSVRSVVTVTLPDGRSRSYTDVFGIDDLRELAASLVVAEGLAKRSYGGGAFQSSETTPHPMVAGCSCEVGALGEDAAHWWWRASEAQRHGQRVDDEQALQRWWKGMSRASRATFRAIHAEGPAGDAAVKRVWWEALGKKRRNKAQERHGEDAGVLKDASRAVKSVARAAAPIAKSAVRLVPVYGETIAQGIDAAETAIDDPKRLALLATAGVGSVQALNAVERPRTIKDAMRAMPALSSVPIGKLATAKALERASTDLLERAPNVEGFESLLKGAASSMKVARSIQLAEAARAAGAPVAAKRAVAAARSKAMALVGGNRAAALQLLKAGSDARRRINAVADTAAGDVLARARAGRVRSNRGGVVTPDELLRAHQDGRVFFVQ